MMRWIWILLVMCVVPVAVIGQGALGGLPVHVSVFNESTAIPFTRLLTMPVHPGLEVGTDWTYREGRRGRLFQTANVSYYYHAQLNQGIGVHTELGYEYRLPFGLVVGGLLGLGYMHTIATTKEYAFVDGNYVERADVGNARFFPSLSVDLGYCMARDQARSPRIYLRYQSWAEYPYSPGFIPVMTHVNLHLGFRFFLHSSPVHHEND